MSTIAVPEPCSHWPPSFGPQLWHSLYTGGVSLARSGSGIYLWPADWTLRCQVSQASRPSDWTCLLCGNWSVFAVTVATPWQSIGSLPRMRLCRVKNNFMTSSNFVTSVCTLEVDKVLPVIHTLVQPWRCGPCYHWLTRTWNTHKHKYTHIIRVHNHLDARPMLSSLFY